MVKCFFGLEFALLQFKRDVFRSRLHMLCFSTVENRVFVFVVAGFAHVKNGFAHTAVVRYSREKYKRTCVWLQESVTVV